MYPHRSEISWQQLNPAEGIYRWEILDGFLEAAISQGKQLSFRVYTMRGESFGGHQIPDWVLEDGAQLLPSGEPDYSNCVYQQRWGEFVEALRVRYDGNPNIAFIDISGYGNFSEWSWRDEQTRWDYTWEKAYEDGKASRETMRNLDSQARRRLADMFIGGSFEKHRCRGTNRRIQTIAYDYPGFQTTQLVMPYAGIRQSTQYVFTQRPDVGFRYDCLGRSDSDTEIIEGLGIELEQIWRQAPIVFEFCGYLEDDFLVPAEELLQAAHGSLVHDNLIEYRDERAIRDLMRNVGYRYVLHHISYPSEVQSGESMEMEMIWQNVGYAPSYPKMGQIFRLEFSLVDEQGKMAAVFPIEADIASWMPADPFGSVPPEYEITQSILIPPIPPGTYITHIAIIDTRTGKPIRLAIGEQDLDGRYILDEIKVD
jgi:hypothetical protein